MAVICTNMGQRKNASVITSISWWPQNGRMGADNMVGRIETDTGASAVFTIFHTQSVAQHMKRQTGKDRLKLNLALLKLNIQNLSNIAISFPHAAPAQNNAASWNRRLPSRAAECTHTPVPALTGSFCKLSRVLDRDDMSEIYSEKLSTNRVTQRVCCWRKTCSNTSRCSPRATQLNDDAFYSDGRSTEN